MPVGFRRRSLGFSRGSRPGSPSVSCGHVSLRSCTTFAARGLAAPDRIWRAGRHIRPHGRRPRDPGHGTRHCAARFGRRAVGPGRVGCWGG